MQDKKSPEVAIIIRPDGKRWHLDDDVDRALEDALARARLWRQVFGADLLDLRRSRNLGMRAKLNRGH